MSVCVAQSDASSASSTSRPWRSWSSTSASDPLTRRSIEINRSPSRVDAVIPNCSMCGEQRTAAGEACLPHLAPGRGRDLVAQQRHVLREVVPHRAESSRSPSPRHRRAPAATAQRPLQRAARPSWGSSGRSSRLRRRWLCHRRHGELVERAVGDEVEHGCEHLAPSQLPVLVSQCHSPIMRELR